MQTLLPLIEELIPLPASAAEAMPRLSVFEEIEMRARTIKLLSDLTLTPLSPTPQDACEATRTALDITRNPQEKRDLTQYPNEMMAYLAGLIQESNMQLVEELSELKLYVVNKLVFEVEHAKDSKNRIAALSKLGEVDGIDAFKKRTSVEHSYKDAREVEKALSDILTGIEYEVIDEKADEEGPEGAQTVENGEESEQESEEIDEILAQTIESAADAPETDGEDE